MKGDLAKTQFLKKKYKMIIIRHRVNKIDELGATPPEYGVEIDIRGYGDKLLLNHDPIDNPENYDELEEYLKHFNHSFIIFNVKEAGYERKIIDLAKKYGIENYFLLDVEFPFIYSATRKKKFRNIAIRFSEAEPIEMTVAQKGFLDWVWVDTNTKLPLNKESFTILREAGFKICLVCPERWGRPEDIQKYKDFMEKEGIEIDAVMTNIRYIPKWKAFEAN